ncbi:MAG: hemolysin family protein [Oscillospiraceae bacterium]|nr:hemolysin family protein [Oscillospiraceae bacterium]
MIYAVVAGILLMLVLSAYFSGAEMAYSSCNSVRLENAAEDGSKRAKRALRITEHFDDALGAILIGNNLANIACSSLCSVLVILLTGSDELTWLATVIVTVVVIIFCETIPKIICKKNANTVALRYATLTRLLMLVLKPLVWVVVKTVDLFTSGLQEPDQDADEAVDELQSLIETAEDEAVLDEDQSELVQAAIDFADISVSEIMTARVDVTAVDVEDSLEEILRTIDETAFSRIPVYEGGIDNIIGILSINRLLRAMTENRHPEIRSMLMYPCFIYKTVKLPDVLATLRKEKQHLAVITDEYGGTLGVVSMEDVLEQLVGEIWDETDDVEEEVVERVSGEYELDGDMSIADFLELMEIDEESFEGESETLGGWTIESFGCFPKEGESFRYENFTVTVLQMDSRRVEKVLVKPDEPETDKE